MSQNVKVYRTLEFYAQGGATRMSTIDTDDSATICYWRPETDDTGALYFGDGTKDFDVRFTLGSAAVYAQFDVGNSRFSLVGVDMATDAPVVITDATESTSTSTGALIVSGGIANAKDTYLGDDVFLTSAAKLDWAAGNVTLTHSTGTLTNSGVLVNTGAISIDDTTESTSTTTGSLHTDGGLGVAKDIYAGDDIFLTTGAVLNFNAGEVTITHSTGALAAVAAAGFTFTSATLNASTGRVGKFVGTVAAPNQGDGYGAFEVDITASGTFAGTTNAFSSWLNLASGAVPGGNLICAQNNGIYLPTGITASSAKMVMGMRMQYVADDGANPGELYCFSTNIYSNVLTAIFDVNAIVDLGGSTGAQTGNDYKIPLFRDTTAGQVWYVNVYHT